MNNTSKGRTEILDPPTTLFFALAGEQKLQVVSPSSSQWGFLPGILQFKKNVVSSGLRLRSATAFGLAMYNADCRTLYGFL